jgi:hypothetical protein
MNDLLHIIGVAFVVGMTHGGSVGISSNTDVMFPEAPQVRTWSVWGSHFLDLHRQTHLSINWKYRFIWNRVHSCAQIIWFVPYFRAFEAQPCWKTIKYAQGIFSLFAHTTHENHFILENSTTNFWPSIVSQLENFNHYFIWRRKW